jgi:acetyl-CoA acetyltransferase
MISQACATSAVAVAYAATAMEAGDQGVRLVVLADRTSNGPHLTYPSPSSPGGTPIAENWVMDNFRLDPWAGKAMVDTAEAVAAEERISREEIDEVTALRYEQYARSLADDRAFQRRYMVPVELPAKRGESRIVDGDVGVHPTSRAALAELKPVAPGGVVTYGTQTHPADGAAGVIVTSVERARSALRAWPASSPSEPRGSRRAGCQRRRCRPRAQRSPLPASGSRRSTR